jgi:selenide,water dikinase
VDETTAVLLHDAQTSGGLLLAVGAAAAPGLLDALTAAGLPAARVGRVTGGEPGTVTVHS